MWWQMGLGRGRGGAGGVGDAGRERPWEGILEGREARGGGLGMGLRWIVGTVTEWRWGWG